jgi:hypothetical protein
VDLPAQVGERRAEPPGDAQGAFGAGPAGLGRLVALLVVEELGMDDFGEVLRRPVRHDLDGAQGDRFARIGVQWSRCKHAAIVHPPHGVCVPGRP